MSTSNNLRIRDARTNERDLVREVTLAAYEEYATKMTPDHWAEYRQVILAALDKQGSVECIVAERDGMLVGSVLLFPPSANVYAGATGDIHWPEVRLLAVAPTARGQGVGAALMDECARRARQMGATALGLHTSDEMQAAIRMYERMGFVRVPEHDFHAGAGQLVMGYRRELSAVKVY